MAIHPTAIVEDGAQLADGVEIGPYCVVSGHARLEEGVRLGSHVVIRGHVEIGGETVIDAHTVIGGEAQIRNVSAREARVVLGRNNVVREGVTISAGSQRGGGITRMGDRNYLMAYSHLGHDCHLGNDITLSNGVQLAGHVEVDDGVIMGGLAAAQQFSRVGKYAFISGLSGVSLDIIPYGMAIGLHARHGGLNLIGLRRRGIPRANIHALRAAFRLIFQERGGSIQDRAREASERWQDVAEVQEVTSFILGQHKRGVAPGRIKAEPEDEAA